MRPNKYYVIVSSLLYVASSYSLHQLSEDDSEDTLEPRLDSQSFMQKKHKQENINVYQDGNYLIAVQELENNVKENIPAKDTHTDHATQTHQNRRHRRSTDYKYRSKKKESFENKFNSVLKRNEYWSTSPSDAEAVVDLLVIVDYSAYQQALNKNGYDIRRTITYLETYYNLLVNLINTRYEEMNTKEFSINIRPADIVILRDKSSSNWVEEITRYWQNETGEWERVVDPQELLDKSHEWLLQNANTLPQHDHVMTFVGHRMVRRGRNSPSSGMAYVKTICQTQLGYSCSVIHETWGFGNAGAATHELGHSLGATHDGLEENKDCPAEHGYIMAPSSSPQDNYELNFFSFSPCSMRAFKKTMRSEQAECLYDSKPERVINTRPGDLMTPEKQCKEVFGPESGQCQILNLQEPEEICQRLWCSRPMDDGRISCSARGGLHAVYGTSCGKGKICYNGRCVHEGLVTKQTDIEEDLLSTAEGNLENFQQHERYQQTRNSHNSRERVPTDNRENSREENTDKYIATTMDKEGNSDETESPRSRISNPTNTAKASKSKENHRSDKLPNRNRNRKTNRGRTRPLHRVPATTTTTTTTTVPTTMKSTTTVATGCTGDRDERYCRYVVSTQPEACSQPTIGNYCCFSCGFVG